MLALLRGTGRPRVSSDPDEDMRNFSYSYRNLSILFGRAWNVAGAFLGSGKSCDVYKGFNNPFLHPMNNYKQFWPQKESKG